MTEIEMDETDITREKAKEFVSTGNTIKAEEILEQLWTNSSKNDVYLFVESVITTKVLLIIHTLKIYYVGVFMKFILKIL